MSVLGINDYLFVDGYRRVLEEFLEGRFPKLEAIFPVVELRLSQMVGVGDDWNRINYHVIFEQGFDPDIVEAQFISGLSAKAVLVPGEIDTPWSGISIGRVSRNLGRGTEQVCQQTVSPNTMRATLCWGSTTSSSQETL